MFRPGNYILAIPTSLVESIENGDLKSSEKVERLCNLRSLLRMDDETEVKGHIMRLRQSATSDMPLHESEGLGISADAVIGNMPLMAIPPGELLVKAGIFAGVDIMENGDISLILDLEKIQAAVT